MPRPLKGRGAGPGTPGPGSRRLRPAGGGSGRRCTKPPPPPPGAAEAYVHRAMHVEQGEFIWAMDGTKDGASELMGVISLKSMDRKQSEVGYWVAPPFWNTGLASMAVEALVNANPLGDATMFAAVFQDNPASARVLAHCGFEYLGDAESFSVARNANVPTWTYSRKL